VCVSDRKNAGAFFRLKPHDNVILVSKCVVAVQALAIQWANVLLIATPDDRGFMRWQKAW
jgi:hypothetical protein